MGEYSKTAERQCKIGKDFIIYRFKDRDRL